MSAKKAILSKISKRKFWAGLFVALGLAGVAVPGPVQEAVTEFALAVASGVQEAAGND